MEPIIQLDGVGFRYDGPREEADPPWALRKVHLTVVRGEYLAVMGPNGSGKSTLAKMLNALLLPDEGRVWVDNLDPRVEENVTRVRRKVGMVFQNPDNQIVGTTVQDDVAFGLENLGVPRKGMLSRIENALHRVNLTGVEALSPHHLSGGQKQRLAIAGVIAMRPEVIVFDEATSMLDPVGRKDVLDTMQQLHREGKTIIHITHSAREAFRAERVAVLVGGQVEWTGAPDELFRRQKDLTRWSLDVPLPVELHDRLRRRGLPIPQELAGTEELVESLWRLLSRG